MTTRRFLQLDVFAPRPGTGNPLAVVLDADGLDDTAMQAIARWTRLPETTFVFAPTTPGSSYRIRMFAPQKEVPFAGHPSVGSAHAVLECGLATPVDGLLVQDGIAGQLPLRVDTIDGVRRIAIRTPRASVAEIVDAADARLRPAIAGWALGALSAGIMAGNLAGPLLGGALPPLIGIRATFWLAGGVIFLTFLATTFLIREERKPPKPTKEQKAESIWAAVPDRKPVIAMLVTGMLLLFANMSIEPIITVYVMQLMDDQTKVTLISGVVMAAAALGSILSSSRLGRLADRIGHTRVIIGALSVSALLLIPQAFVTEAWQLIGLRFLMGLALGGLLPCISSVIRHNVPDRVAGGILGLSVSAQYVGQVAGPVAGGFVGGHFGMRSVFLGTCLIMMLGAFYNWTVLRRNP